MTKFINSFSEETWAVTYKDHADSTVDDSLMRVAKAAASKETTEAKRQEWTEKFYDALSDFKITTGGRIYANAGTAWGGTTLLNCFTTPAINYDADSLEGIYQTLINQAKTLKSEGGWGCNFSFIRPRGSFIHGIGVESPGAVRFMELFDKSSDIITSGSGNAPSHKKAKGKIRKGAQMAILDVTAPDVVEFITAKQTPGRLTKFNMSVNITDAFMRVLDKVYALKDAGASEDEIAAADQWDLVFPDTEHPNYRSEWNGDLKSWKAKGYPVIVHRTVSATWLWNLIMESTYARAEPGVLFLDRANFLNPANYTGLPIMATNPCGEQMLPPGGVCDLGSLNLTQMLNEDFSGFDLARVRYYVGVLVRFLDNINDLTSAPLPAYEEFMRTMRRIGCGVLGWGSALYMLKVRFGSAKAEAIREELMRTIAHAAYEASIDLAEEKGMFPACDPAKHAEGAFIQQIDLPEHLRERIRKVGIRNSALLSMQPTGNTSIFANNVSGGIEPVFSPEYIRTVIVGATPEHLIDVSPRWQEGEMVETAFFKWVKEGDDDILRGVDGDGVVWKIDRNRGLTKEVPCQDYGVRFLSDRGEWDPNADWAVTATGLTVQEHVNDLKGFARYVDSAISKTINLPYDYPFEQFKNVYLDAYKTGYIKGLTTYRSGTMASVLATKDERSADPADEEIILETVKMPSNSPAAMRVLKADQRKWYLTVVMNEEQTRPFALFVHTNSRERTVTTSDALDRLFALARRKGIPECHVADVETKVEHDDNATKLARAISLNLRHGVLVRNIVAELDKVEDVTVGSFLFQIKKYLTQFIKDGERADGQTCDNCGSNRVVFREGCYICENCSASKCA